MHAFPWYVDLIFGALALVVSWQFWAALIIFIATVVAWFKHK